MTPTQAAALDKIAAMWGYALSTAIDDSVREDLVDRGWLEQVNRAVIRLTEAGRRAIQQARDDR